MGLATPCELDPLPTCEMLPCAGEMLCSVRLLPLGLVIGELYGPFAIDLNGADIERSILPVGPL